MSRIDLIWDVYLLNPLKASKRKKRGQGQKVKLTPRGLILSDLRGFLHNEENKVALFAFLASAFRFEQVPGKVIITTIKEEVYASPLSDCVADIDDCNHEEADSRMILHAFSCV